MQTKNKEAQACYLCREIGNMKRECPQKNEKNGNNEKLKSKEEVCKFCNKKGHLEENCWSKKKSKAGSR